MNTVLWKGMETVRGILILAHGGKINGNIRIIDSLVEKVRIRMGEQHVYPVYLKFDEEKLANGIERLVKAGIDEILIIPLFIFDGMLYERDIPCELNSIRCKYPNVCIKMSKHIGDDDKLAEIIVNRIYS